MDQPWFDFLQQYGYIGIFLFLLLGIVGIPLPDEIMMTFIGYLTSTNQLTFSFSFASAFLGSICGITLSYVLGYCLGYPFLKRFGGKIWLTQKRLRITQILFRRYGNILLFIGYFIPGVRHLTAYLAGVSKIHTARFVVFAYTGALFWCFTFIGMGHVLGANWEWVFRYLQKLVLFLTPILLVGMGWYFWRLRRTRSH